MRIYWFCKWEKPVQNILICCINSRLHDLLKWFTRKIPKCLIRTEIFVFIKTKYQSLINTHYNLHTYIQHYETSERRSKILNRTCSILRGKGLLYLGLTLHSQQQNISLCGKGRNLFAVTTWKVLLWELFLTMLYL